MTEPYFKGVFEIYEKLSKFYKCSFDGKKILIEDFCFYIEEPFRLKNLYFQNKKK